MTIVNDKDLTTSTPAPTPEPHDVLNDLVKRMAQLELENASLKAKVSQKRGRSEEDQEIIDGNRKRGLKALSGLDIDKSLKGWIKVKTPGNTKRHPSISISKGGGEVFFMGLEWKSQEIEGMERITKAEATHRHIGFARGEADMTKDITKVLEQAAEFLKSYKSIENDDEE